MVARLAILVSSLMYTILVCFFYAVTGLHAVLRKFLIFFETYYSPIHEYQTTKESVYKNHPKCFSSTIYHLSEVSRKLPTVKLNSPRCTFGRIFCLPDPLQALGNVHQFGRQPCESNDQDAVGRGGSDGCFCLNQAHVTSNTLGGVFSNKRYPEIYQKKQVT